MLRLYCPDLRPGEVELPPEEAHHATASLRAKVGTPVTLFDGQGHEAEGSITNISKRTVIAQVGEVRTREFECAYRLTIAIALGKAHRQSYVVEKCTELGVEQIWPMITERSVTKPREAAVEKWSRRAIEAAKQSGRAFVPTIAPPQRFADVIARVADFDARAIADVLTSDGSGAAPRTATVRERPLPAQSLISNRQPNQVLGFLDLLRSCPRGSRILCLMGPEGGWSNAERSAARAAGLDFVRLAPTVLRTETAAVTACAAAALATLEHSISS